MFNLFETPKRETVSIDDAFRLGELETVISRGLKTFVDVGNALLEIRESRLYRAEFRTFEDYCQEKWGMDRNYANKQIRAAETVGNLGTIVPIIPVTESQARPLTSLPPQEQAAAWKQAVETAPEGKITAAHVQAVVDEIQQKPHVSFNSGNNEWYTPDKYISAARAVMGEIDLDPASSEIANRAVRATVYFTEQDDGLRFSWDGRVWMNPPYSGDVIGKFCDKLVLHFSNGEITEAIVLVNNATETGWFQALLSEASSVCFPRQRIKFIDMQGNPSGAPLQGQAILYFGENSEGFVHEFSVFGKVLHG